MYIFDIYETCFDIYETCFDIKCCRTCRMKTVNVDKICRYSHQNHDNMYTSSIHVYSLQKHKTLWLLIKEVIYFTPNGLVVLNLNICT